MCTCARIFWTEVSPVSGSPYAAFFAQHFPIEFEDSAHYLKDAAGDDIEPGAEEPESDGHAGHDHGGEDIAVARASAARWTESLTARFRALLARDYAGATAPHAPRGRPGDDSRRVQPGVGGPRDDRRRQEGITPAPVSGAARTRCVQHPRHSQLPRSDCRWGI